MTFTSRNSLFDANLDVFIRSGLYNGLTGLIGR
jgi:hypothetical protein